MTKPSDTIAWENPAGAMQPGLNQVHLWKANIQEFASAEKVFTGWLSAEEKGRLQRYRSDLIRHRFLMARGLLRAVLAYSMGCRPADLDFDRSEHGKPFILHPDNDKLSFNLSHSANRVLIAVASGVPVGVDIESIDQDLDYGQVARNFFSADEINTLMDLNETTRRTGFYNCWTRKEAYLKAIGKGLHISPRSFTVTLRPDEPAEMISNSEAPEDVDEWRFLPLIPDLDYIATLVVPRRDDISFFAWHATPDWLSSLVQQ